MTENLRIKCFQCNPLQENCYVVSDAVSRECVVIDCGAFFPEERKAICQYITGEGLKLSHVLLTHGHFDHVFGVDTLYKEFGLSPRLHSSDVPLYEHFDQQTTNFLGVSLHQDMPAVGSPLVEGKTVSFGQHIIDVIHTPGHSPGSVVLYIKNEDVAFTGDTLFRMSIGRTDLEGGSWSELESSLKRLGTLLPSNVKLYCGHGPASIMADELRFNPYLR
jgi:glyoxylase-like metal-dependent hydrolase (beta-lactamase superfamily II)